LPHQIGLEIILKRCLLNVIERGFTGGEDKGVLANLAPTSRASELWTSKCHSWIQLVRKVY